MPMTIEQQKTIEHYWSQLAEEEIRVRPVGDEDAPIHAFGSELAMRRLKDRLNAGTVVYVRQVESWSYVNRDEDDSAFRKQRIMKALQYHADGALDRYRPVEGINLEDYERQRERMNTLGPVVRQIFFEAMTLVENNW